MTLSEYFKGDELASSTWKNKYAAKGEKTPDDMHHRIAVEFAKIEAGYILEQRKCFAKDKESLLSPFGKKMQYSDVKTLPDNKVQEYLEGRIYNLFKDFKYVIPGGSVMASLGTDMLASLSNCFVIGSPGDSLSSVMENCNEQAQLMKRRGGVGFDLSTLRPAGALVHNSAKTSTGSSSFMDLFSMVTNTVGQAGRRGALMLSISIDHPDVEDFIRKKQDLTRVTGANISVKITDSFMNAVNKDDDYYLRFPIDFDLKKMPADSFNGDYYELKSWTYKEEGKEKHGYIKKVKAKNLWNLIMRCAWNTAEPGILFIDRIHDYSPDGVYEQFKAVSTNPCGEIPLEPYDSCRLIHMNLTSFVINPFSKDAKFDFDHFYEVSYETMRLADDLVDLEIKAVDKIMAKAKHDEDYSELKLWKKIQENATAARRTGVGFTGLADMFAMMNFSYDAEESLSLIDKVMKTMMEGELDSTVDMAVTRGAFEKIDNVVEDKGNDWYKFVKSEMPNIYSRMKKLGRRNISFSTVAPTGTVSMMTGTSSGIEPLFMPFYQRRRKCMTENDRVDFVDKTGVKFSNFVVVHSSMKRWAEQKYKNISNDIIDKWSISEWEKAYKKSPWFGSTAAEINWGKRVKLQGIIQKYITHSISSTVNLPTEVTAEEISDIYMEAWKHDLKGITVYRDKCRDGILNEIKQQEHQQNSTVKKRPKTLEADYFEIKSQGIQYIVLVGILDNKPYEVFTFAPGNVNLHLKPHKGVITKVKKGQYSYESEFITISDLQLSTKTIEEKACTLYSSMLLRHGAPIDFIIKTAKKVNENIGSFSSAMCRVLSKYVPKKELNGEVCPKCGGRLIREAGCVKCMDCDYSVCL